MKNKQGTNDLRVEVPLKQQHEEQAELNMNLFSALKITLVNIGKFHIILIIPNVHYAKRIYAECPTPSAVFVIIKSSFNAVCFRNINLP